MSTNSIYIVAAKSEGEVLAHCLTRTQLLRHVIADSRTRDLFEFWGDHWGIDALAWFAAAAYSPAARSCAPVGIA